jgi:outer membrane lipoprotein-sorting protein
MSLYAVRLIGVAAFLASAGAAPAVAQTWLERLFSGNKPQPADVRTAPSSSSAGLPATAKLPPKRPASLSTEPAESAESTAPASAAVATLPPATPALPAPSIVTAAAPGIATAPAPSAPLSDREIIERANAYFSGISTLVGDFVQIGGDGRRLTGKLYLQRPGKIRFEYSAPATLEVVADGSSVAVRDRKLATQDLYSISQTPLKFLLRDRIDLNRDVKIVDVANDADGVRIAIEDKSTLGGTSKITLFFDPEVKTLARWRIIDPQGFNTSVALSNLERRHVDAGLFVINSERVLGEGSSR